MPLTVTSDNLPSLIKDFIATDAVIGFDGTRHFQGAAQSIANLAPVAEPAVEQIAAQPGSFDLETGLTVPQDMLAGIFVGDVEISHAFLLTVGSEIIVKFQIDYEGGSSSLTAKLDRPATEQVFDLLASGTSFSDRSQPFLFNEASDIGDVEMRIKPYSSDEEGPLIQIPSEYRGKANTLRNVQQLLGVGTGDDPYFIRLYLTEDGSTTAFAIRNVSIIKIKAPA